MVETITLLGKRVYAVSGYTHKVPLNDGFVFSQRGWYADLGDSILHDDSLVRAAVYDCDGNRYYASLQDETISGCTRSSFYSSPQAAADAIEEALRELVNGEWRDAVEYLSGLRRGVRDISDTLTINDGMDDED